MNVDIDLEESIDQPFKCDLCNKSYSIESDLKFHKSKRHAVKKRNKGNDYEMLADVDEEDGVPSIIDDYEDNNRGCCCRRWRKRHPFICGGLWCCGSFCIVFLIGIAFILFSLFSITGARLTDNTVIKASELCSFDATVLTIDGFVNNPCIIPVSIVGGDFELRRTSNNKILAHGDIPAFDLTYGQSPMKNVVAKVKHNDINDIGAFTTSLFNQNQEDIVALGTVHVKIFGIGLSANINKVFHLNEPKPNVKKESSFRFLELGLSRNDDNAATFDTLIQLKSTAPWLDATLPKTTKMIVTTSDKIVADLIPHENAPNNTGVWHVQPGWNTWSVYANVTKSEAQLAGKVVNSLVASDLLPLVLTGADDDADKCFIQKVLSKTKVKLDIPTGGPSKIDGTAVQRVKLNSADHTALHADVGVLLGRGFVDGAKDIVPPPPDASPRIKLRGSIPPLSIALAASVAVDDNHPSMIAPAMNTFKPFSNIELSNWTLSGTPSGSVAIDVSDVPIASDVVDALSLHSRDVWMSIATTAAQTDVVSRMLVEVRQQFQLPREATPTQPGASLKDKLLASAQVNITDITSTGLSGVASALLERDTGKVDFDIQLKDIGVSVSDVEDASTIAEFSINLATHGSVLNLDGGTTSVSTPNCAALINELVQQTRNTTVKITGKDTANSNIVSRILSHLSIELQLVDLKDHSKASTYAQFIETAGGEGGVAHVYVHFNTTANPYIDVNVPRLAVALRSASSSGALLNIVTDPFEFRNRFNGTQTFKFAIDVPSIQRIGDQADLIFQKRPEIFTAQGVSLASLPTKLKHDSVDNILTKILQDFQFKFDWQPPKSDLRDKTAVLPAVEMSVTGSTSETLDLKLRLKYSLAALPCVIRVGDLSIDVNMPYIAAGRERFPAPKTTSYPVTALQITSNNLSVKKGENVVEFKLRLMAQEKTGSKRALQHMIYAIASSSAEELPLQIVGGVKPANPLLSTNPPFKLQYSFIVPKGGAGGDTDLFLCKDQPILKIHTKISELLLGKCSIDVTLRVYFANPLPFGIKLNSLKFDLRFDDWDGASRVVYHSPRSNILLGRADMNNVGYHLDAGGISPLNVKIVHGEKDGGWHETCIRVGSEYFLDNQLVVRLEDGYAEAQIDQFKLPVLFANVSFPLDKNDKHPITCENILKQQGKIK